jgi:hypothetical protein
MELGGKGSRESQAVWVVSWLACQFLSGRLVFGLLVRSVTCKVFDLLPVCGSTKICKHAPEASNTNHETLSLT